MNVPIDKSTLASNLLETYNKQYETKVEDQNKVELDTHQIKMHNDSYTIVGLFYFSNMILEVETTLILVTTAKFNLGCYIMNAEKERKRAETKTFSFKKVRVEIVSTNMETKEKGR